MKRSFVRFACLTTFLTVTGSIPAAARAGPTAKQPQARDLAMKLLRAMGGLLAKTDKSLDGPYVAAAWQEIRKYDADEAKEAAVRFVVLQPALFKFIQSFEGRELGEEAGGVLLALGIMVHEIAWRSWGVALPLDRDDVHDAALKLIPSLARAWREGSPMDESLADSLGEPVFLRLVLALLDRDVVLHTPLSRRERTILWIALATEVLALRDASAPGSP